MVFGPLGLAVIFGFGRSCMCRYGLDDIDGMCCGLRTTWLCVIFGSAIPVCMSLSTRHCCYTRMYTHDVEYCATLIHFFSIHMHNIGACCRSQSSIVWLHKELLKLFLGWNKCSLLVGHPGVPWNANALTFLIYLKIFEEILLIFDFYLKIFEEKIVDV